MTKTELNSWMNDTSELLVKESLKILLSYPKPNIKEDVSRELTFKFITKLIETMLDHCLNEYQKYSMTEQKAYEFTQDNYIKFKTELQHSISESFEEIMLKYSGKSVDYYCDIRPIGESINKQAC